VSAVTVIRLLCAGAAKAIVAALQPAFIAETGAEVVGEFGAVGAMKAKLLAGDPCDLIVLTAAMIAELAGQGHVEPDTIASLGSVATGVAIRSGDAVPAIGDAGSLRRALLAATALYVPDPERATAGIHFVGVLGRLGIAGDVTPRLRAFPNGAIAMRALADANENGGLGCTQVSEILYTPGVTLVGALPGEFALTTVYSVAVCARATSPQLARRVVATLSGPGSAALRAQGGFVS
jgi:molybdate transport system substrate-binding protein